MDDKLKDLIIADFKKIHEQLIESAKKLKNDRKGEYILFPFLSSNGVMNFARYDIHLGIFDRIEYPVANCDEYEYRIINLV